MIIPESLFNFPGFNKGYPPLDLGSLWIIGPRHHLQRNELRRTFLIADRVLRVRSIETSREKDRAEATATQASQNAIAIAAL